jgi:hypothetical protein
MYVTAKVYVKCITYTTLNLDFFRCKTDTYLLCFFIPLDVFFSMPLVIGQRFLKMGLESNLVRNLRLEE